MTPIDFDMIRAIVADAMIHPDAFSRYAPPAAAIGFSSEEVDEALTRLALLQVHLEDDLLAYREELLEGLWDDRVGALPLDEATVEDELAKIRPVLSAFERFEEIAGTFACPELGEELDEYREDHAHRMRELVREHLAYELCGLYMDLIEYNEAGQERNPRVLLEARALKMIADDALWERLHETVLAEQGPYELDSYIARSVAETLSVGEALQELPAEFRALPDRGLPSAHQE